MKYFFKQYKWWGGDHFLPLLTLFYYNDILLPFNYHINVQNNHLFAIYEIISACWLCGTKVTVWILYCMIMTL